MVNKPLWKNKSGTFTYKVDGKWVTIQADETFRADESEIPKAFRDTVVKIGEEPETVAPQPAEVKVADPEFAPEPKAKTKPKRTKR